MNNLADFAIQWHITESCQNKCKHCYMGYPPDNEDLNCDQIERILTDITEFEQKYDAKINYFSLTGGDPFHHPEISKILNLFSEKGKHITILGIPEQITEKNISLMKRVGVVAYQVSLDGLKDNHDWLRGNGSFDKTISAIKKLYDNGIHPTVMYTVSNRNYGDLIGVIDYLDTLNIPISFGFDFVVNIGNASDNNLSIDRVTLPSILSSYLNKKRELTQHRRPLYLNEKSHHFTYYDLDKKNVNFNGKYSILGGCSAGWRTITIMPNGDVYPCRRLPLLIGNLMLESFESIFLGSPVLRKIRRRDSYKSCGQCNLYNRCRGCLAEQYGRNNDPFSTQELCMYTGDALVSDADLTTPDISCAYNEEYNFIANSLGNISQNRLSILKTNRQYCKATILLSDDTHRKLFLTNPIEWCEKNNIDFSPSDADAVLWEIY